MTNAKRERIFNRLKEAYMHLTQEQLAEILATITLNHMKGEK